MIEERTMLDPYGRPVVGVFVRNHPWRGLLMAQRHEGLRHTRFRQWRFEFNYAHRRAADYAEIYAYMCAQGKQTVQRSFQSIDGGKLSHETIYRDDDPASLREARLAETRQRWREMDGFVPALEP